MALMLVLGSSDMLINAELSIGERSGAEIADGVLKYTSPVKLTGDTTIRTRTMHNGQWSALVEHSFQAGRAGTPLRFTEIMYNPPGGSEYEFVELHNSGTFDVSLEWHRFDGIDFHFCRRRYHRPRRVSRAGVRQRPRRIQAALPRPGRGRLVPWQPVKQRRAVGPARCQVAACCRSGLQRRRRLAKLGRRRRAFARVDRSVGRPRRGVELARQRSQGRLARGNWRVRRRIAGHH